MQTIKGFAQTHQTSESVIRTWISRHGLTVVRVGRKIYIMEEDYNQWIVAKKTSSNRTYLDIPVIAESGFSRVAAKMKKIY